MIIKWLVTLVLALVLFAALKPLLQRLGLGRMPGDFRIMLRGRLIEVPLASTVLLSLLAAAIGYLL